MRNHRPSVSVTSRSSLVDRLLRELGLHLKRKDSHMASLEDAVAAVVAAVDGLEAAVATPVVVPETDALRVVVEAQLVAEGWTAPVAPEAPADVPAE